MARVATILIVLIAIALLANKFLLHGGDPMPAEVKAPAAKVDPIKDAPSGEEAAKETADQEVADAAAGETVETDVAPEAVKESGVVEEAKLAASAAILKAKGQAKSMAEETVPLGGDELTSGIPGEDSLSLEQITTWLADPKNHVTLKPELPMGLAAGAAEIWGLEANPLTRAKIELGRQLFFDQRLSSDGTISCASCHDPDTGYAAATQFGVGVRKQVGNRNSPVAFNRILSSAQFWDGRAASLEEQAKGPIANPVEMSNTHAVCVGTLMKIPDYVLQFDAIFDDGLNIENVAKAIAAFERTLVTGPAPWDYYKQLSDFEKAYADDLEDIDLLKEDDPELYEQYMALKKGSDEHPISESAIRGGELFFSDKSGCTACHVGVNFTDEKYHNLGVGMTAEKPDLGRFEISKDEKERGAFKTPTVRNISDTGPYMHDGSQKTLEEVVEWYVKGGHSNQWLDEKIKKLELSDQDKQDLVAFMREGLQGSLPKVQRLRLPSDPETAENVN